MSLPETSSPEPAPHGMRFGEFVALIAALIGVNALGIDMMLPALGVIGRELELSVENYQQLVIAVYIGSFGVGQLIWGPLADRYGRRPILLGTMAAYAAMSFIAAHSGDFELLLIARALQGLFAASTRVLGTSIVRDCYSGRRMAKVMSLTFMVFLAVPIVAPTLGQLVLLVAPWRWIFYILGGFSIAVAVWAAIRLPETLDPARRRAISVSNIVDAMRQIATNRYSLGYSLGLGFLYGGLLGFLNSSQQILNRVFQAPELFALCFAVAAGFLAVAALLNARIVERYGMRVISHVALLALILTCVIRLGFVLTGHETLLLFTLLNAVSFFFYGLTGSNFGAMAMEPMAHIAGTASSVQGVLSTLLATTISLIIGQSFAGTTLPLTLGWTIGGLLTLGVVMIVERGRLFRAHNAVPPAA